MPITNNQLRAARALIDLSREDLAEYAGVAIDSINKFENGHSHLQAKTEKALLNYLERRIEFLDGEGVRLKSQTVEVFEGVDGFTKFHDLVYSHLKEHGGEACVCGSSSTMFSKYRADGDEHRKRMADLVKSRDDVHMRILAEDGDTNMLNTAYATYRWMPKENFPPVAFYAFGDYLAEISFEAKNPPLIVLIKSPSFADAYRRFFSFAWNNAKEPPKRSIRRE